MRIGKVTESVLKRSVLKILKDNSNKKSAVLSSDCAYSIDENKRGIVSAVSTFTADAEDGGYYAVYKAANNIFTAGAEPSMVVLNVLLDPETDESSLKEIIRDCKKAADELEIPVKGGHTEVTDALKRPVVSAYVTGVLNEDPYLSENKKSGIKSADEKDSFSIVMTKWTGVEGTAILAEKYKYKLLERLPGYMISESADFKRFLSIRKDAEIARENGALFLHDVSSGGIFAALWEIAEMAKSGLDVDLKAIPIRQETVEITNHLGVNPYQMLSGGSLIFLTDREDEIIQKLEEEGVAATVIGRTTSGNDRIIRNDGEVRFLDKPQADELVKN